LGEKIRVITNGNGKMPMLLGAEMTVLSNGIRKFGILLG